MRTILLHYSIIFVYNAGIDGYSRLVTYLHCSSDNKAATVLDQFVKAIDTYGVPSRVRCDLGVENVDVGRWMLQNLGTDRSSIITGRSVHNQRIERLWRDVNRVVVRSYRNIFYYLESQNLLDPDNETHLYCLHRVFLPKINHTLQEFRSQYNHHPMRSEHNQSPYQIFIAGVIANRHSDYTGVRNLLDSNIDPVSYGVDEDGPSADPTEDGVVQFEAPILLLTLEQEAELNRILLSTSEEYGIDQYINGLELLAQFGFA